MNNKAKLLIKSFTVMVLLFVAGTAFAANGDTINIGGTVPLILTLTVTPDGAADNLPLTATDLATTEPLASIDISTNNTAGWELYVFSTNGATLNNSDGDTIGYTLTYAGTGGVATTAPSAAGVLFGQAGSAATDAAQAMTITYNQSTSYPAGYYSDQLTIVLRAK